MEILEKKQIQANMATLFHRTCLKIYVYEDSKIKYVYEDSKILISISLNEVDKT